MSPSQSFEDSLTVSEQMSSSENALGKRTYRQALQDVPAMMRTGGSAKEFACPIDGCNKQFTRRVRLNAHMHLHYGTQPFKCTFKGCTKSFSEKQNLRIHFRVHTGEKPFVCKTEGCGMGFATKGNLLDHERRHSGLRPFNCNGCGKNFYRRNVLTKHL